MSAVLKPRALARGVGSFKSFVTSLPLYFENRGTEMNDTGITFGWGWFWAALLGAVLGFVAGEQQKPL